MRVYHRRRERRYMRQLFNFYRLRFNPYLSGAAILSILMLAFTLTGGTRSWV